MRRMPVLFSRRVSRLCSDCASGARRKRRREEERYIVKMPRPPSPSGKRKYNLKVSAGSEVIVRQYGRRPRYRKVAMTVVIDESLADGASF